mmetsp:Transcript_4390/g.11140  ORF Transcript_4390/g.11140 Transcript_4390/m.11140 type:complete len:359 (-) Transcript_4390:54-1130(-)
MTQQSLAASSRGGGGCRIGSWAGGCGAATMGQEVSKVDDGLFQCGVQALDDVSNLHKLGVTHILNVARRDLYRRNVEHGGEAVTLHDVLHKHFTVKIMDTNDSSAQDLSPHFAEMAAFIAEGRAAGGVAVHCAAGISRATTATVAYLVMRCGLTVDAAFTKVFCARPQAYPNEGFWRQLRDLEGALADHGVDLHGLSPASRAALGPAVPEGAAGPVEETIAQLDRDAARTESYTSMALTAVVSFPEGGAGSGAHGDAASTVALLEAWQRRRPHPKPGVVLANVVWADGSVSCRFKLVASRGATAAADIRAAIRDALAGSRVATREVIVEDDPEGGTDETHCVDGSGGAAAAGPPPALS